MNYSIIKNLYQTFSKYRLHDKVTGCYCEVCLDEAFNDYVHKTPVSGIPLGYLLQYVMSVDIIEEDGNDFKYFLPRILEVLLQSEDQSNHFFTIVWKAIAEVRKHLNEQEKKALQKFGEVYYGIAKQSNDPETTEMALLDLQEANINIDF